MMEIKYEGKFGKSALLREGTNASKGLYIVEFNKIGDFTKKPYTSLSSAKAAAKRFTK